MQQSGPGEYRWRRLRGDMDGPGRQGRGPVGSALSVLGLLVLAAALSLALFLALRPNQGAPVDRAVAPPAASPEATTTPAEASGPAFAPTPIASGIRFRLALWANELDGWRFGDLDADSSSYREGEAIPVLLRIDEVEPATGFWVAIRYDCGVEEAAAFDFLTGYERDVGTSPALAEGGPGRLPPDATMPIPSDASIAFDDEQYEGDRLFHLWGATFDAEPLVRGLDFPCTFSKIILLRLRALSETVFLMWGGHLGSSEDWGADSGASSLDRPFGIAVAIPDAALESEKISVGAGAVSP